MASFALSSFPKRSVSSKRSSCRPIPSRSITVSSRICKALPFFLADPSLGSQPHKAHQPSSTLRMLMFGKPGAGKGTLSARLVRKYEINTLSTGDLLRSHITQGTELGRLAEGIMKRGELLPDELVLNLIKTGLESLKNEHWTLDGFPRTLAQGELLDAHLESKNTLLNLIVNIDVPDDVILSRITDRWTHLPSGRVYNLGYNQPKVPGRDDVTGDKLVKRPDDTPEVFSHRLERFYGSTAPLLDYYASRAKSGHPRRAPLSTISGTTSDEIWPQLDALVRHAFPGLKERSGRTLVGAKQRHLDVNDAMVAREERSSQQESGSSLKKEKL